MIKKRNPQYHKKKMYELWIPFFFFFFFFNLIFYTMFGWRDYREDGKQGVENGVENSVFHYLGSKGK